MKYYLPTHCDSGNRGCEAIVKATSFLLGANNENIVALSNDINLDIALGVNNYVTLKPSHRMTFIDELLLKIRSKITHDKFEKRCLIYQCRYGEFMRNIKHGDIVLSTGGDMFCYDDNEAVFTSKLAQRKGCKTILWGCSLGKQNITAQKLDVLRGFDMIYVRESLSMHDLRELGLSNVVLYPDPAFILKPEKIDLPQWITDGKVIGINCSNFVMGGFCLDTPFAKALLSMIDYILENTDLMVMLVPHVLWEDQDDRKVSEMVYNRYKLIGRVHILKTNKMNYCQIRYAISKCRFFIGGRTHAVISAYSTCIPTIALGYSIKSRGIAKDLGLPSETVINCKGEITPLLLTEAFKYLQANEMVIKEHLKLVIPEYVQKVYGIKEVLKRMI